MMDNMQTEAQPTRTRILNAAREIFSENGFHSASMKAICKSCAISPGTLYHHFISKEALIDRNLNPQKTKKAPQNGYFFNTPCAPYERKR
ncbi:TetR/AcrR family transcriptional regulator, partial [Escherichia coli]|uniref:TetR/AcrR family transcriptional regulator n=1 Tax=Escherichia coli TaxID=562 RepID=UPI001F40D2A5